MNLFDVYPLFDINIVKGKGRHVWDENGTEYLKKPLWNQLRQSRTTIQI